MPHLPPHLLANPIRTSAEALSRHGEIVRLVLQSIETLPTLRDLVDVVAHDTDRVVDLLPLALATGSQCSASIVRVISSWRGLDADAVAERPRLLGRR